MTGLRRPPEWTARGGAGLQLEPGGGRDRRRPARPDRIDDLARIDPLQIRRGRPQIGVAELALDDVHRDALTGKLDGGRVAELSSNGAPISSSSHMTRFERVRGI